MTQDFERAPDLLASGTYRYAPTVVAYARCIYTNVAHQAEGFALALEMAGVDQAFRVRADYWHANACGCTQRSSQLQQIKRSQRADRFPYRLPAGSAASDAQHCYVRHRSQSPLRRLTVVEASIAPEFQVDRAPTRADRLTFESLDVHADASRRTLHRLDAGLQEVVLDLQITGIDLPAPARRPGHKAVQAPIPAPGCGSAPRRSAYLADVLRRP